MKMEEEIERVFSRLRVLLMVIILMLSICNISLVRLTDSIDKELEIRRMEYEYQYNNGDYINE